MGREKGGAGQEGRRYLYIFVTRNLTTVFVTSLEWNEFNSIINSIFTVPRIQAFRAYTLSRLRITQHALHSDAIYQVETSEKSWRAKAGTHFGFSTCIASYPG